MCRQRLGKLKGLVNPMLERAAEARERPRAVEAARSFLELVAKSVNAWEAIKPWVNHTQRLDLLAQVCTPGARAQTPWVQRGCRPACHRGKMYAHGASSAGMALL